MKPNFDKYKAYSQAVQAPEVDVKFYRRVYRECTGEDPTVLREDFCAAFAICCAWAKLDSNYSAIGLDLDPEPIAYGREHYLAPLPKDVQKRIKVVQQDVLRPKVPSADIVVAVNFSYSIFKERKTLLKYFKKVRKGLSKDGVFILDNFGGPYCYFANKETRKYPEFSYQFEQTLLDPMTHEAKWSIHFTPKNGKKIVDAFTYDWRLWTIPELRDLLIEAGFKDVAIYWEGTDSKGEGNGRFDRREKGDECYSWIAYVVGIR